ncbi:class II aldolase/adducin family protein [Pigmentiphaga sp.]|uniref:class II aldolase/adducin family protein n=1 Tax=Pigmentiphaga sp. TaxID=1977564 RepID=UPI00128BD81A|nr:class II aldolase/adducin family protein [Pigmentiphaga sp.]MPS29297.1 class II aldolase/adducin family protein [Alcaligenaceae bacterium SAGV5]MPS54813.1 class II aldolase/adducin family protein [Alcaligenaceae bacterium SAGV3]MPT56533.1 class II aldolase/adducin family protein [Alcaligenaceae bacterium]
MQTDLSTPSRPGPRTEEWQMRVDLAACYRLHAHYGWTDLIYTHISARVPGAEEHFLLNPFGLMFDEVRASNLVKIDIDGNVVEPTRHPIHRAGFVIHSAVHAARPDARCVIHAHTRAGMAVSAMKCGLLPLTQHAMLFHGKVAYHDSEGLANQLSERERLTADLGDKPVMILRNHGTLVAGASIGQAFAMMWHLEMAMQAQVDALASGQELTLPEAALADRISSAGFRPPGTVRSDGTVSPLGNLEWPALLRMLDRKDPSYRT